ncbi:MAG: hypothetical protein M1827_001558 [Pycnora praestabilis]|nr:MAG: hypothetical protein M1827_001558 [Pycnora praestabilis]
MAANDYYNPASLDRYSDHNYNPSIQPPSPSKTPANPIHATAAADSPVSSHFDERMYQSYSHSLQHQPSFSADSAYHGANSGRIEDQTPYADDIPLREYPQKLGTQGWAGSESQQYLPSPDGKQPDPMENAGNGSQRRRKGRGGFFSGKIPWVVYILTTIQVGVFIAEIVKNSVLTKSPIEIHPQFNPMIGPSFYVLVNMGARYVPCMRSTPGIQDSPELIQWPCPNTTTTDLNNPSNQCTLSDLCGVSGVPNPTVGGSLDTNPQPNQWFRFIIPMFLHAGIVHIGFNMLLQLTLGRDMEKLVGSIRFALVYFSSGIFGFVLGGNYAASGIASTGCSGSLFGILALVLLDLLYTWSEREKPWVDLAFVGLDVIISFVLGLLPGLDNFSHIGGFLCGLVLGVCLLHSPNALRQRIGEAPTPYAPVMSGAVGGADLRSSDVHADVGGEGGMKGFAKGPVGFFKGRKPLWWAWWLLRAGALVGVLVCFIVLLNNFYKFRHECKWCKYLSCLPIKNWCDIGNFATTTSNTTSSSSGNNKRDLHLATAAAAAAAAKGFSASLF